MFGQYQKYHDFFVKDQSKWPIAPKKKKDFEMQSTNLYRFCKKI